MKKALIFLVFLAVLGLAAFQINNPSSGNGSSPTVIEYSALTTGGTSAAAGTPIAQNTTVLWGFAIPVSISTSAFCYYVQTIDNSANLYDIGVYSSNGTLLVHTGATAGTTLFPSTGVKCQNWSA